MDIYSQIPQRWEIDSKTFEYPDQVEAGDMDTDGDLDIIVASGNYSSMKWFENIGTTFSTVPHELEIVADRFMLSDVDGDGYLDIVGSRSWYIELTYYLNTSGTGLEFEEHDIYAPLTGAYAFPFTVADLDSDGDDDIIYTTIDTHLLTWAENTFSDGGEFITHNTLELINYPKYYAAGDFDSDGDMDIITATIEDAVCWIENPGSELFTDESVIEEIENMNYMTFADLQGDNDLDLLIGSGESYVDDDQGLLVLFNDSFGNFSEVKNYYETEDVFFITTGYVNEDTYPDVVLVDNNSPMPAGYPVNGHILYGNANDSLSGISDLLSFIPPQYDISGFKKGVLSDINNDGFDDLAITVDGGVIWSTNEIMTGPFSGYKQLAQLRAGPRGLSYIDLNGADESEMILFDENGRINSYVFDAVANLFKLISKIDSLSKPEDLDGYLTFDYNNDGLEDLFLNTYRDCESCLYEEDDKILWVYKNLPGLGIYDSPFVASTEKLLNPVTADVNGDGFMDIVASYPNYYFAGYDDEGYETYSAQYNIYWLKNEDGSGIFNKHMITIEDTPNQNIAKSGDMDNDGDMDVISINNITGNLGWLENIDGAGNFSDIDDLIDLDSISSFELIDEDNDNDLDLLIIINGIIYISINESGVFADTIWRSSISDGYYSGLAIIEDMDHDNRMDVVGGSYNTYYYHNTAISGIDSIPATMTFYYNFTIAADINSDGISEIAGVPDDLYFESDSAFAIEINPKPVYLIVEHSNDSLILDENQTLNDTITVRLNTIPAETCYMKFNAKRTYDPEYEIALSGADPQTYTMLFNADSTALNPQTIIISALNDFEIDSADAGKLFNEAYSEHNIYNLLIDNYTNFDIIDNDYYPVSTAEMNNELTMQTFYNEAQQNLFVTYLSLAEINIINLYTIDGKLVANINANQSSTTISVDCSEFAKGLYLIELIDLKNNLRKKGKVLI